MVLPADLKDVMIISKITPKMCFWRVFIGDFRPFKPEIDLANYLFCCKFYS
jgi:hypothetical protein